MNYTRTYSNFSCCHALNFEISRIYPGIPEYFNGRGRGMYHYLTGAASWYLLTVVTEMYGVKGCLGDMVLMPKLLKSQFDGEGTASVTLPFAGKKWKITYENKSAKEYGEYKVSEAVLDGTRLPAPDGRSVRITKEAIEGQKETAYHELRVILE